MDEPIINHDEARELAAYKGENSNLARCYLDLSSRLSALTADRDQWKGRSDQLSEERDEAQSKLDAAHAVLRKLVTLEPSDYYPSAALTAIQAEADGVLPEDLK